MPAWSMVTSLAASCWSLTASGLVTSDRPQPSFMAEIGNLPLEKRVFAPIFEERIASDATRHFLRVDDRDYSYGEIGTLSLDFARGLKSCSVGRGDIVTIMLPNCLEFIVAWFGIHLCGACVAFVNPAMRGAELVSILDDCQSRVVIVKSDLLDALAAKEVFKE